MAIVEDGHIETFLDSTVVLAVSARTSVTSATWNGPGEWSCWQADFVQSARPSFRSPRTDLVELAHAYLEVADPPGARAVLQQVRDMLAVRPQLGVVATQADQLQQTLDTIRVGPFGASTLTAVELRLLPLLATHLSLADIVARLYVSRNTVKSQAVSTYRKLGVSARSQAIRRGEEVGLLSR